MSATQAATLEFPEMLHGLLGDLRREVRTQGQRWAREYLKTGGFTQPQRLLQVHPGEVLLMHSGADSNLIPRAHWRPYMFHGVFTSLHGGVGDEERQRMEESFDSFCLSTPWGALVHAVSPLPPRSAARVARRLAALLRCWDVLQGPRYSYWYGRPQTLEELVKELYGMTLSAWCPESTAPMREQLAMMVERMARATREDCLEAVLRVIPFLVREDVHLKHREKLSSPAFLREYLAALSHEDWEDVSSAYRYSLSGQLCAWDRMLDLP